jgi:uncharacterized protein YbjT (DUF2867 family)
MREKPVLVTGATGYVGGRLVPLLLDAGYAVRAAARNADKVLARPWGRHPNLTAVSMDVMDQASLEVASQGCGAVYYLVHSMAAETGDFAARERKQASNMCRAARNAGVARIIYLGGLGGDGPSLSKHLRSRLETAEILSLGPVPLTWLKAAMILGSGSASFEILRYLVERLPVMLTPKWVHTRCQPICIRNVLGYLTGCLENPETAGRSFDIGGPDILTYAELFNLYAQEAGITPRRIIPVPLLSPRLSSFWVSCLTPVDRPLVRALVEGLRNEVVCHEHAIRDLVPQRLISCREAIRRVLGRIDARDVIDSCHLDTGPCDPPEWAARGDAPYAGGSVLTCGYKVELDVAAGKVWDVMVRIGGDTGWYYGDNLWKLRGWMDKTLGGPGHGRGRRDPVDLRVGDALDFWRVLAIEPGRSLVFLAEMRVPGQALLSIGLKHLGPERCELSLQALFKPRGVAGLTYWYAVNPLHVPVFKGMLAGMAQAAGGRILAGPERLKAR